MEFKLLISKYRYIWIPYNIRKPFQCKIFNRLTNKLKTNKLIKSMITTLNSPLWPYTLFFLFLFYQIRYAINITVITCISSCVIWGFICLFFIFSPILSTSKFLTPVKIPSWQPWRNTDQNSLSIYTIVNELISEFSECSLVLM